MKQHTATSIEQSRKLIELGLSPTITSDMVYIPYTNDPENYSLVVNIWGWNDEDFEEGWIPAWSLAALLNLMPKGYRLLNNSDGNLFNITYPNHGNDIWKDSLIETAFETTIWLIKNNVIKNKVIWHI